MILVDSSFIIVFCEIKNIFSPQKLKNLFLRQYIYKFLFIFLITFCICVVPYGHSFNLL